MKTKIYGYSDDLIEIDGLIRDEVDCYNHKKPIKITASDGTIASIFYNGEWKINVKFAGSKYVKLINSVGDDSNHIDNDSLDCPPYSDVLILGDGIEWIKIKGQTFNCQS